MLLSKGNIKNDHIEEFFKTKSSKIVALCSFFTANMFAICKRRLAKNLEKYYNRKKTDIVIPKMLCLFILFISTICRQLAVMSIRMKNDPDTYNINHENKSLYTYRNLFNTI